MQLLDAFQDFAYPNEIGPGVYDIHTPNTPEVSWMAALMEKALEKIPAERLWVNPDCGLKTREWADVEPALATMVKAAHQLRQQHTLEGSVPEPPRLGGGLGVSSSWRKRRAVFPGR